MSDSKDPKLEKKLRELQDQHKWSCVYEMSKVLDNQSGGWDWSGIARAAYHAGAAKVIQEALF